MLSQLIMMPNHRLHALASDFGTRLPTAPESTVNLLNVTLVPVHHVYLYKKLRREMHQHSRKLESQIPSVKRPSLKNETSVGLSFGLSSLGFSRHYETGEPQNDDPV